MIGWNKLYEGRKVEEPLLVKEENFISVPSFFPLVSLSHLFFLPEGRKLSRDTNGGIYFSYPVIPWNWVKNNREWYRRAKICVGFPFLVSLYIIPTSSLLFNAKGWENWERPNQNENPNQNIFLFLNRKKSISVLKMNVTKKF